MVLSNRSDLLSVCLMGDKWHLSVDYICISSPLVCTFLYLLPAGEDDRPFQLGGNVGVVPGRQQQPWQSPPNLAEGPQRPQLTLAGRTPAPRPNYNKKH